MVRGPCQQCPLIYGLQKEPHTLTLIISEAALETVPKGIRSHPSVIRHAERLGAKPAETLLDRSYHHAAMKTLTRAERRGRPDIVHFALMEALSTPLFFDDMISTYVHTAGDKVIKIAKGLRIPKSYFRFEGLMMDLFRSGLVKSSDGRVLMELSEMTLEQLLRSIKPDKTVGLTVSGVPSTAEQVAKSFAQMSTAFLIGGFPRGHFSETTTSLLNHAYSINPLSLEAHVVIARLLYECEMRLLEGGVHHESYKQGGQVGA